MEHKWHSLPVDDFHQMDYHSGAGRALGELGAVRLSRRQFVEALDALLRAGYWVDAAYVAERVLTLEELKTYVDREWSTAAPPGLQIGLHSWTNVVDPNRGFALRHLLARRLARAGRWRDARGYFPPSLQGVLDEYVKALREGKDSRRSAEDRGESMWKAATIARRSGMELLGTELDPDWALHGGDFNPKPFGQSRGERAPDGSLQVSREEKSRVEASAVEPEKRFHYRYIAGQHALAAVELLPEESEQAARWLCIAGSWIEKRDPKVADRFYKMLVKRCGKTELGKEAARLRWFPRLDGAKGAGKAGEPPGAEGGTPVPAAGKVGEEGAKLEGDAGAPRASEARLGGDALAPPASEPGPARKAEPGEPGPP
jgi:hypothetical protein